MDGDGQSARTLMEIIVSVLAEGGGRRETREQPTPSTSYRDSNLRGAVVGHYAF